MNDVSMLTQLGVGGIFAVLVIRQVLDFVDKHKSRNGNSVAKMERLIQQTSDLHRWHSPDDSGEQSWKNTRMIKALENNNRVLESLIPVMERVADKIGAA